MSGQVRQRSSRWKRGLPVILGTLALARLLFASLVYAGPELAIANDF